MTYLLLRSSLVLILLLSCVPGVAPLCLLVLQSSAALSSTSSPLSISLRLILSLL